MDNGGWYLLKNNLNILCTINLTIYLNRKYKLYNFFKNGCRSLEEFNELLQTNIGESCDANTEINLENNKSKSSYSVEIEPEKSE